MQAIVLSDEKPGHYNQSLGVIQRLPECEYHWIDVRFRGKRRENLLRVFMRLFGGSSMPQRHIKSCLRILLPPETTDAILAVDGADLILSTGSSVAALNLLLGKRFDAKTVTCQRPSPVGIAHFDLAILPKTEWPPHESANVCKILGLPNAIHPEKLSSQRTALLNQLNLPDGQRIGVLIGGEDRYETISEETARRLIRTLREIAAATGSRILATTSRRTPLPVENLIGEQFSDPQLCPICVLAHRESPVAEPMETILALSDLIIVTADSFAMVCEAASSGKRVIILEIDQKTRRPPKRHAVYEELTRQTSVLWSSIADLAENVRQSLADEAPVRLLQDTAVAAEAVRRLLD